MAENAFPADHFRRVSDDGRPILWSVEEVGKAISDHFALGRNPNVDERVADLWDAAFYIILARLMWEGWLVDWKSRLDDPNCGEPDSRVPACLFEYCAEAVDTLAYAGALRTGYEDESTEQILLRFPPTEIDVGWYKSSEYFSFYCSKVAELIPLQAEMVRLQQHFESSPDSELPFRILRMGTRTLGNYPGTFLDVFVGYDPGADDHAIACDKSQLRKGTPAPNADLERTRAQLQAFAQAMQVAMDSPEYRAAQEAERQQWQSLADAIREAVEAAGDELESRHFARPETIENWEHLARIVEILAETITAGNLTAREIFACALAWADGQTIKAKLRAETKDDAETCPKVADAATTSAKTKERGEIEAEAESDDALPKSKRANSPSRLKARSAYDYAMERIPNAHAMTAAELFDAIKKDGEAAAMLPPTAESFTKYLNDCGIRLKKGGPKAAGGSVVRWSDL